MGFSQKQAVAVLYVISAILGLSAVVLTTNGTVRAMLFLVALCVAGGMAGMIFLGHSDTHSREGRSGGKKPPAPPLDHSKTQIAGNNNFFGEEDRSDK